MNINTLIYILIAIIIFILFYGETFEHLTSNEAVQNVASLYNVDNLTVTNASITGNAIITGIGYT